MRYGRIIFAVAMAGIALSGAVSSAQAASGTDTMVGYWKLDETSGTSAADSSGDGNTGTHTNGPTISTDVPTTVFTDARSLSFDGTDDYVVTPSTSIAQASDISVFAWVKLNATDDEGVVSKYASTGNNRIWYLYVGSNKLQARISHDGTTTSKTDVTGATTLTTGVWYHVGFIANLNGALKVYVNGVEDGSQAMTSATTHSATIPIRIGDINATNQTNGLLDDVRIYNRALSSTEITDLAAGSHTVATWDGSSSTDYETAANWDTNAIPDPYTRITAANAGARPVLTANVAVAGLTINSSASLDLSSFNLTMNDSGTFANNGTLLLNGTQTITSLTNDTDTGTVIYRGASNLSSLPVGNTYNALRIEDPTENGLVGYWKLDGGGGTSALDISGSANTGTLTGGPTHSTDVNSSTAYYNPGSVSLDGTDDYIPLSSAISLGTTHTVSMWVKPNTQTGSFNFGGLIGQGNNTGPLFVEGATDTIFGYSMGAGAVSYTGSSMTGVWHHITSVRVGTSVTLYLDGASVTTGTLPTNDAASPDRIGERNASLYYKGLIDDVRIYNRELSATEVANLAAGRYAAGTSSTATHTLGSALTVNGALSLDSGILSTSSVGATVTSLLTLASGNGTLTAGSGTVTLNGGLTVAGGVYTGGSGTTDVNGAVLLSSGTLTAPSGTLTISGNYTKNGGTFEDNSGTVTFDGSGAQTLNSGGTDSSSDFNHLTVNKGGDTLTVDTNAVDINGTLTVQGGTLSPGGNNITANAAVVSGGTLTRGAGSLSLTDALTVSSGTYNANGQTTTVPGLATVSGGTYTASTAAQAFNGGLTVSGGTYTGGAGGATVTGALAVNSGTYNANGGTTSVSGLATVSGGTYTASTATQTLNGGLTVSGGTLTGSSGTVDVNGALTVSSGTLTAPSGSLTVSGAFAHTGGTFTHNSGTVTLDGADQTLSGATTFNNLTKTVATARTLTFPASAKQTIAGTMNFAGASGALLSLRSSSSGTQWQLDPQGTRTISYLDVKDSNNTNATAITTAGFNITDSGNNTGWSFNPEAPTNLAGTATSSTAITWTWTDNATDETGFRLYSSTGTLIATIATANTTSYTETGLTRGTSYSRYVVAYNSAGNSTASSTVSVTTLSSAPTTPSLQSPGNGATITTTNPTFTFTRSTDSDDGLASYTFILNPGESDEETITFNNPAQGTTTSVSNGSVSSNADTISLTVTNNEWISAGSTYLWRIRATDNAGNTATSSTWEFTVAADSSTTAEDTTPTNPGSPSTTSDDSSLTELATKSPTITQVIQDIITGNTPTKTPVGLQLEELAKQALRRREAEAFNLQQWLIALFGEGIARFINVFTTALANWLQETGTRLAMLLQGLFKTAATALANAIGIGAEQHDRMTSILRDTIALVRLNDTVVRTSLNERLAQSIGVDLPPAQHSAATRTLQRMDLESDRQRTLASLTGLPRVLSRIVIVAGEGAQGVQQAFAYSQGERLTLAHSNSQSIERVATPVVKLAQRVTLGTRLAFESVTGRYEEPLTITDVTVETLEPTRVVLSWNTSHATYGKVNWGETTSYGADGKGGEVLSNILNRRHHVELKNVAPNTKLYFEIVSTDATNRSTADAYYTVTTPTQSQ